jgi:hypothetical protein
MYPDIGGLLYTTGQAIPFICIAVFESLLLGSVLFDKITFDIRLINTQISRILGYSSGDHPELLKSWILKETSRTQRFINAMANDLRTHIQPVMEYLSLLTRNP